MCRNIKTLHHFAPPATVDEVHASALQYVRKLSGINTANKTNKAAFDKAVHDITHITLELFENLQVSGPPRNRETEKLKAQQRGKKRDEQMRIRFMKTSVSKAPLLP